MIIFEPDYIILFYLESEIPEGSQVKQGIYPGELFFLNGIEFCLLISQDYGANWIETNSYNINLSNYFSIRDMIGGRTEGEIYTLYRWSNLMEQNAHYILYSTDYGIAYEGFFIPLQKVGNRC
ncbi:MAG: hypothetical protein R2764_14810 [Bacteroidales bacterium]